MKILQLNWLKFIFNKQSCRKICHVHVQYCGLFKTGTMLCITFMMLLPMCAL